MSQKLKVVTIGGGSSYTPELLEGNAAAFIIDLEAFCSLKSTS